VGLWAPRTPANESARSDSTLRGDAARFVESPLPKLAYQVDELHYLVGVYGKRGDVR